MNAETIEILNKIIAKIQESHKKGYKDHEELDELELFYERGRNNGYIDAITIINDLLNHQGEL